jgi:RNA polymerase sigma-70 factor (ECF subfamily)
MQLTARDELLGTAIDYAPELARYLMRRVSDAHDAQDLMQELYLALLKVPDSQLIRHHKAYLFTIAGNLAYQHCQRAKVQPPHVSLEDVSAEVLQSTQPPIDRNDPEYAAIFAECLSHLERRLNELSAKTQAAVLWHHRDGYTCDEIGKKLSVVTHRVKKYLVRGLSHCRTIPVADVL